MYPYQTPPPYKHSFFDFVIAAILGGTIVMVVVTIILLAQTYAQG